MSDHALGERSGAVKLLRQAAGRGLRWCRRVLAGVPPAPGTAARSPARSPMLNARLTVGEVANQGWKAYGAGVPLTACPYVERRARDAWRSSWRSAQQFDRVFR